MDTSREILLQTEQLKSLGLMVIRATIAAEMDDGAGGAEVLEEVARETARLKILRTTTREETADPEGHLEVHETHTSPVKEGNLADSSPQQTKPTVSMALEKKGQINFREARQNSDPGSR